MNSQLAAILAASLDLQQPPVAISFTDTIPAGVKSHAGRVPAGCRFWEDGAATAFATTASDHNLCAIGVYTHNLQSSPAQQTDLMDALKVFGDLDYVRPEDLASIPVLASRTMVAASSAARVPSATSLSSSAARSAPLAIAHPGGEGLGIRSSNAITYPPVV